MNSCMLISFYQNFVCGDVLCVFVVVVVVVLFLFFWGGFVEGWGVVCLLLLFLFLCFLVLHL